LFAGIVSNVSAQSIKKPEKKIETKDTVKMAADSSQMKGGFQDPISYTCTDSLSYDFTPADTIMRMYTKGKVKSLDMEMEADFMEMSRKNGTLFGAGVLDTAGILQGKPVFRQGGEEFQMDTMTYNYLSKKARIINVYTKQGDGFLLAKISKRMPDNSTFIKAAKYTTCDAEHKHFYMHMTRGKVTDKPKNIYFGPSYLVIEDVPFPLVLPFGFFPQMSGRSSGLRIPTYGEEVRRGFFLRNGGYYLAIGDYMDLDLLGDYYTMGSWAIYANSRYTKRYKFNGGFNLAYAYNTAGDKGSPDYETATTFSVRWNHSQSPKARPGTTFSASVNFASANSNRYMNNVSNNPYSTVNNSISSSISYGRSWQGSPLNLSVNANHSQNMRDSSYAITFPNVTFTVARIYPFERKERIGNKKPYEEISFGYTGTFDNKVNFRSKELSDPNFAKKINNGFNHSISIGLPTATVLKYVKISPSISYGMKWFFKDMQRHWDPIRKTVIADTSKAFGTFGITNEYSFGASANTQIYGTLNFKKGSLIEAVRHVVKPSISISYQPNLKTYANGWRKIQSDSLGNTLEYNIYAGQSNSPPSANESGSIGFSLGNSLEMKVRNRKDTTGIKKVALLNTFNISASYNLLADSMNLSNISFNGSTNLPGKTAISFNFTVDPYAIDYKGHRYNKFHWAKKGGLNIGRLTNFNTSLGYSFSGGQGSKNKDKTNKDNSSENIDDNMTGIASEDKVNPRSKPDTDHDHSHEPVNPLHYEDFIMPWNLSFNFSYSYSLSYSYVNNTLITNRNHNFPLNFSGKISPTPNWDISLSSGFDFKQRKLTMTNVNISRKLHCFSFTFTWVPIGSRVQSWSFKIGILSSMLSDVLKYDKQSNSYWDGD
jgi:hypothetical protein